MKFEEVKSLVAGVPFLEPERAKILYDFILEKKPANCLELGFAHGTSSCYIAAALDEIGAGHLTSVDLESGLEWQKPSIDEMLAKTGLQKYVTVAREKTSYTWFLKKAIEQNTVNNNCQPVYDFCFIDGAKNWTIDGLAFFLVDKLLKTDGWILFDDLTWTYAEKLKKSGQAQSDGISMREMGEDELNMPHLEAIFRLLVMQHPDYAEFKIQDDWWGWAHKIQSSQRTLVLEETDTLSGLVTRGLRRVAKSLK